MKINWFSPLPPARTDIAHYTRRILAGLTAVCEPVLWACQEAWDPAIENLAPVRRWTGQEWAALNEADITFFHLGNNALFHAEIWRVARRHPGILVLHDQCLQHFFRGLLNAEGHAAAMRRHYGEAGALAAANLRSGRLDMDALARSYPLGIHGLVGGIGAVTHSREAFDEVAAANRWPVCRLDLPYPAAPLTNEPRTWPPDVSEPLRLILFGYLGSNRRLVPVLRALARFPGRRRLRLDIYGQIDDPHALREELADPALRDLVQVHGFVPDEELERALAQAHLAINLRYPTMGEASGSQLRIWNQALPSLVTRTGWYADLPVGAVGFVDPEREEADLHRHWQALLEDHRPYREQGLTGRRLLEARHDPVSYARDLLAFAVKVIRMRPLALLDSLPERVGAELRGWQGAAGSTSFQALPLRQVATAIHALCCPSFDPITGGDKPLPYSQTSTLKQR